MPTERPINFWRHMTDDFRDLEEDDDDQDAYRLDRIVSVATTHPPGVEIASAMRCDDGVSPPPCDGRLRVSWEDAWPPIVRWSCPRCGDRRSMWGWEGSSADARGGIPTGAAREGELVVSLSYDEYDAFAQYTTDGELTGRMRGGAVLDPAAPERVLVRGLPDEIDGALDFVCYMLAGQRDHAPGVVDVWRRLDAALGAAGLADRHDQRDERVRWWMRKWARGDVTPEPFRFPDHVLGYTLVFPKRGEPLLAEVEALNVERE